MLSGKQGSGTHRFHHPFLFFFSGDRAAPPLSPLRWASEAPGRQWAAASRPARRLPPRLGSHAPSTHSPRGPRRQGQRPPAPLPRPARAPLQPRAALRRRGAQRRRGPRAEECEPAVDSGPPAVELQGVWQRGGTVSMAARPLGPTVTHQALSTQWRGRGDSALAPARPETAPFRGLTLSPWTLQILPLRAFEDLGMGRVSWVISPWALSVTRGSLREAGRGRRWVQRRPRGRGGRGWHPECWWAPALGEPSGAAGGSEPPPPQPPTHLGFDFWPPGPRENKTGLF